MKLFINLIFLSFEDMNNGVILGTQDELLSVI